MTEKYANNASSTTTGSVNNSSDPVTVAMTSVAGFPNSGQFRILIDSEILLVTSISSLNFTCSRAQEGTTIASHSSGATVTHILTKGALDQIIADNVQIQSVGTSIPATEKAGRLLFLNDWLVAFRDGGTNWQAFGPIYPLKTPPSSSWSSVNFNSGGGTTTVTQNNAGSIYLEDGGTTGNHIQMYARSVPGSLPYTLTAGFVFNMNTNSTSFPIAGLMIRDSGSDKRYGIGLYLPENGMPHVAIFQWADGNSGASFPGSGSGITVSGGSIFTPVLSGVLWLRITEDSSNRSFYVSADGHNFILVWQQSHNYYFTADQYGIFMALNQSSGTNTCGVTLLSLEES